MNGPAFNFDCEHDTGSRKQELLKELNDSQKEVVKDIYGNIMVSASPGSGKTKCVVSRTAYMIEDGVNPSSILLFTFTKKAANEIKERLVKVVGDEAYSVTVSTYHSFCARLLRRYSKYVGLSNNFSIIDDSDRKVLLKQIIGERKNIEPKQLGSYISDKKKNMIGPEEALNQCGNDTKNKQLAECYKEYETELLNKNSTDFDNLILFMVRIMENYPIVKKEINNRWKYLTADEVQDSSATDIKFIFLLGEDNGNMCLVGDPDQSIYKFRGANTSFLFDRLNKTGNFRIHLLGQNYRSTKNIVRAANSLIQHNPRMYDQKTFTDNSTGSKVIYIDKFTTARDEAYTVAKYIDAVIKEAHKQGEDWTYSDIAILCRMSFQTRILEDVFLEKHIKYEMVSGTSFYERMEIKDIMAYVNFILNPANTLSLERIINTPKRGIGDKSKENLLEQILQLQGSCGIIDIDKMIDILKKCSLKRMANKGLKLFISEIEEINNFIKTSTNVGDVVTKIVETIGYNEHLRSLNESDETTSDRLCNIDELKVLAEQSESLEAFIENMTFNNVENEDDDNTGSVKIMTMHGSKGLEFNAVFIVGVSEAIIPSAFMMNSAADIQEERRLLYVAMTRAKQLLFMSSPKAMYKYGQLMPLKPSRFIEQIDKTYIQRC